MPIRIIGEPSEGQPPPTAHTPPKGRQPPPSSSSGGSLVPSSAALQARPLPILWGTDKIVPYIIEMLMPVARQPANWSGGITVNRDEIYGVNGNAYKVLKGGTSNTAPSGAGGNPPAYVNAHNYNTVGELVSANGNAYQVRSTGTSGGLGTGPAGTGEDVLDPNTVGPHWTFLSVLPFPVVIPDAVTWQYIQQLPYPLYSQAFVGALCEGAISGGLTLYWNKERISCPSLTAIGKMMTLFVGPDAANQDPNGMTGYSWDSSGYQHTALITPTALVNPGGIFSGTQKEMPEIALETKGVLLGASTLDVNPADWVNDVLTHTRRGAGWASAKVDATTVTGSGAASYRTYTDAAGLRFSYYLDTQKSALEVLADGLNGTNSDAFWTSPGVLKVVPLADTSITAPVYGANNFVPANTAAYNLGPNDFLDKAQPVQMSRRPDADCFNTFPVEYKDRSASYAVITVEDPDQTDLDVRKEIRRAGTLSLPLVFPDGKSPGMISRNLAQRSLGVRNTFTFRTSWKYITLEPTCIVTLTDPYLGLVQTPVRIVSMRESEDRSLTFTAEDYPEGIAAAPQIVAPVMDGVRVYVAATLQTVPSAYTDAATTRGGNVDNLFPNPTSEKDPPSDADASRPEWVARYDPGAGNGFGASRWVRRINTAIHSPVILGDRQTSPTADQSQLGVHIPCIAGDQFYVEGQVKIVTVSAPDQAGVYLWFLDDTNTFVGGAATAAGVGAAGAYTKCFAQGVAPSGAVRVQIGMFANCATGSIDAYFDALYARRQIDSSIGVPPDYQTPTLATHYTTSGAPNTFVYWKTVDGGVSFAGFVNFDGNVGALNAVVFTLPAGFRPLHDFTETVIAMDVTPWFAVCQIMANGDVRFLCPNSNTAFRVFTTPVHFQRA